MFNPQLYEHQIFSAVVMMGGLTSLTAVETVAQWCTAHDRTQWSNSVVSAFDYSIYYDTPGDLPRSNTMLARGLASSATAPHFEDAAPQSCQPFD